MEGKEVKHILLAEEYQIIRLFLYVQKLQSSHQEAKSGGFGKMSQMRFDRPKPLAPQISSPSTLTTHSRKKRPMPKFCTFLQYQVKIKDKKGSGCVKSPTGSPEGQKPPLLITTPTLRPSLAWQLTLSGVSKAISFSSFPLLQEHRHILQRSTTGVD